MLDEPPLTNQSRAPYNSLALNDWQGVVGNVQPKDIQADRTLRHKVLVNMDKARAAAAAEHRDTATANAVLPHLRQALKEARRYAKAPSRNPHEHRAILHMHRRRIAGLHQEWMLARQGEVARTVVSEGKLWILEGHRYPNRDTRCRK